MGVIEPGLTRRAVLKGAAGAAGVLVAAPVWSFACQGADAASMVRLHDDLFLVQMPGEQNVIAQTGPDGVLLVDGGSARGSAGLLKAVAGLPGGGQVHTLFNTHWHPEVTGSNETLGGMGRPIIAHENTRLWLTTDVTWSWNGQRFARLPKVAHPTKTFFTTDALPSGVRYGHIPDAAHTDGDLYVHFPAANVLAVGDVVSGQGWPVVDWATGGWIGGMVGGLQRVLALTTDDQTRIVPGRGPVLSIADVTRQYEMYARLYERLTTLLNRGRGPEEAVAARPAKEYEAVMGPSDEFVRRSFESLWAYLSPDA